MSEAKLILDYMEKHQAEFVDILKEAVLLESPTEGDKEDLKRCRDYFENLFSRVGFKCTVVPSNDERFGDHLLMEYGEGSEQVLFVGHYDTAHPKGSFGSNLWRVEGTKAFGPGTLDMKGGDVLAYMAAKALIDLGLMPEGKKIVFFLNADEEAGSCTSKQHFTEHAKKSKAAFVMESGMGDYIGGIKNGRFGRGNYTFVAEGKAAHSGLEPYKAESGLIELAKQAVALEALTDYDKVVTVACTCLKSGNSGWPTVPGDGSLTIDARYSTLQLAQEYDKKFQNVESFNPKVKIITHGGIEKPPFDNNAPKNMALYDKAVKVGKELDMDMIGKVVMSGSDGNFTSAAGCPTLDGMGMTGDFVHQPGEYINLDHVASRGAFVARMILEVLRD